MTEIELNGERFCLQTENPSVADLVQLLDLEGKRFAVEVNEDIVSRSEHLSFVLKDKDKVEIVQAIGGG